LKTQGNSSWRPYYTYLIEIKEFSRNTGPMVVAPASKADKIDHQNIVPGGDLTRQLGDSGL
jgi:hypothetical protein